MWAAAWAAWREVSSRVPEARRCTHRLAPDNNKSPSSEVRSCLRFRICVSLAGADAEEALKRDNHLGAFPYFPHRVFFAWPR